MYHTSIIQLLVWHSKLSDLRVYNSINFTRASSDEIYYYTIIMTKIMTKAPKQKKDKSRLEQLQLHIFMTAFFSPDSLRENRLGISALPLIPARRL